MQGLQVWGYAVKWWRTETRDLYHAGVNVGDSWHPPRITRHMRVAVEKADGVVVDFIWDIDLGEFTRQSRVSHRVERFTEIEWEKGYMRKKQDLQG